MIHYIIVSCLICFIVYADAQQLRGEQKISFRSTAKFTSSTHRAVTKRALSPWIKPEMISTWQDSTLKPDLGNYFLISPPHFDNCNYDEGVKWMDDHRALAITAAYDCFIKNSGTNCPEFYDNMGHVLHPTEDFYSHSNWADLTYELNNWKRNVCDFTQPKPFWWISGRYDNPNDPYPTLCPDGKTPSYIKLPSTDPLHHDKMSKDSNSVRPFIHPIATHQAIYAVHKQIVILQQKISQKYGANAQKILTQLGFTRYDPSDSIGPDVAQSYRGVVTRNQDFAYFFQGNEYFKYNLNGDRVEYGYPMNVKENWIGLPWESFDAAVAWPNNKVYFFKGTQYIRFDWASDKVDADIKPIKENWMGIAEAFPDKIDAVCVWPGNKVAYFFSGPNYVRYNIFNDRADPGYPKKFGDMFPGLGVFSRIDAILVHPNGYAYFFSGDRYVRYNVGSDYVESGVNQIAGNWPGLFIPNV